MSSNSKISRLAAIGALFLSVATGVAVSGPAMSQNIRPLTGPKTPPTSSKILRERGGLKNTFAKLRAGQPVTIAYFGGSITAGAGVIDPANAYRARVTKWFADSFPQSKITEVNAAIGGTGTDLGVFRLRQDVLRHHPDLLFIEFAVNDGYYSSPKILQAIEGIFRQTWSANQSTDICLIYTYQTSQQGELDHGLLPGAAASHDFVAEKYGVPAIGVTVPIGEMVREGKMLSQPMLDEDRKRLPIPDGMLLFSEDGVHPNDNSMGIYAKTITDSMAALEAAGKAGPHSIPEPLLLNNFENAHLVPLEKKMLSDGWELLGDDDKLLKSFGRFFPQIWQGNAGETLNFTFKGTTAKLYDIVGPDGGQVWVTVDGVRSSKPLPRFDALSTYHRLETLTLCENLPDTIHTISLEIDAGQPDRSSAKAIESNPAQIDPNKYNGTFLRIGWLMIDGHIE